MLPWLFALLMLRSLLPLNAPPNVSLGATFMLLALVGWAFGARVVRRHHGNAAQFALYSACARLWMQWHPRFDRTRYPKRPAGFSGAILDPVTGLSFDQGESGNAGSWGKRTHSLVG